MGLRASVNARRSLHQVPTLPHDYSQGVPNLMSPGGFAIAWSDYMALMVEKLNALTAGTCAPLAGVITHPSKTSPTRGPLRLC
jgi:Fe-Mn family superoxide dismutase